MTRVLTAAVLIPVVLLGLFAGPWWALLSVIAAVSVLSFIEYSQMLSLSMRSRVVGVLAGLAILPAGLDQAFLAVILLGCVALVLPMLGDDLLAAFHESAAMFLGVIYIFGAMTAGYHLGLRSSWWLLFALVINWIGDSGAYYVGRQFGKHKMAPRISPGKSWEGAIASVVFSTAFFVLIAPRFLHLSIPIAAVLALSGNVAGQLGDLAESALKRALGVKDSGRLLPGHGGMLDRVDGVLFTVPVVYSMMRLLHL